MYPRTLSAVISGRFQYKRMLFFFVEDFTVWRYLIVHWLELEKISPSIAWIIGCLFTEMPSAGGKLRLFIELSASYISTGWNSPRGQRRVYLRFYFTGTILARLSVCHQSVWKDSASRHFASRPVAIEAIDLCLSGSNCHWNHLPTLKGLPFFYFFLSGDREKNKQAEAGTRTLSANLSKRLIVLSPAGSKGPKVMLWYQSQLQRHIFSTGVW